jgi:hypothetical protein
MLLYFLNFFVVESDSLSLAFKNRSELFFWIYVIQGIVFILFIIELRRSYLIRLQRLVGAIFIFLFIFLFPLISLWGFYPFNLVLDTLIISYGLGFFIIRRRERKRKFVNSES